jgi:hypothetical protein
MPELFASDLRFDPGQPISPEQWRLIGGSEDSSAPATRGDAARRLAALQPV